MTDQQIDVPSLSRKLAEAQDLLIEVTAALGGALEYIAALKGQTGAPTNLALNKAIEYLNPQKVEADG